MDCVTFHPIMDNVLVFQMLIGLETLMIASQPQGTLSRSVELQSDGEVKTDILLHFLLLKLNIMWHCQMQHRKQSGYGSY